LPYPEVSTANDPWAAPGVTSPAGRLSRRRTRWSLADRSAGLRAGSGLSVWYGVTRCAGPLSRCADPLSRCADPLSRYAAPLRTAWAAARRATGTRNGEQET
jgi:hypothetical protein